MQGHFRADDAGPNEPPDDPTYDDLIGDVSRLEDELGNAETEIDRLRAELARVRAERDRLLEGAVGCYLREAFRSDRAAMIEILIAGMQRDFLITGDVAAALAEHDRRATEGER